MLVISTDVNVFHVKHNRTHNYVDGIFSRGFLPQILMPTRVTHRSATLIDHLLTNDITSASSSGIITSPPIGGGRGIVMPMSVCLFVCVFVCLSVFSQNFKV